MKKIYIIIISLSLLLILLGCSNNVGIIPKELQEGTIVLKIKRNETTTQHVAKPAYIPAEATNIKLRIFNSNQNVITDFQIPESGEATAEVNLPIGTYTIYAYSFPDVHEFLTLGMTNNVVVSANEYTSTNITLQRPQITYEFTDNDGNIIDTIEGNQSFNVRVSIDQTTSQIINGLKYIYVYDDNGTKINSEYTSGTVFTFTAPTVETESKISFNYKQIATNDLNSPLFRYDIYLPSTNMGETRPQLNVIPPEGGIIIGIN